MDWNELRRDTGTRPKPYRSVPMNNTATILAGSRSFPLTLDTYLERGNYIFHHGYQKFKNILVRPSKHLAYQKRDCRNINIDIVGPLPKSCNQRYLITIIDRNTRWPEAIPIPNITTAECVQALVGGWISRFGIPEDISSDRGSQFTSALWTEIAKRLGVKVHRTTAFHPQANGMVKRFHRTLKAALKARLTGNNWVEELPWVLLGLRIAPKEDLGYSSAELVYGEPLTVPGEFTASQASPWSATDFLTAFRAKRQLLTPRQTVHHSKQHTYLPPSLLTAKYVYIRTDTVKTQLQRPYSGPYTVLAPGEKTFLVDMGGRAERISIDRLKSAQVDPTKPVQLQQPARRGRPPALPRPPSATETDDTRGQPAAQTHHRQLTSRTGRQAVRPRKHKPKRVSESYCLKNLAVRKRRKLLPLVHCVRKDDGRRKLPALSLRYDREVKMKSAEIDLQGGRNMPREIASNGEVSHSVTNLDSALTMLMAVNVYGEEAVKDTKQIALGNTTGGVEHL
ncbi:Pol polyprotein [Elysia marginata]|uniref:Pol polyprotein n=1 Tax=Elysia marginata TaxID=1093978 RepID=A0AAV4HXT0_9GAST|nr:Pol polyprotein [Elysia marginata]